MKNDICDALRKNDELPDIRNTIEEMIFEKSLMQQSRINS